MDALQAEEALEQVARIAAGSGLMKPHEHQRLIGEWRRRAQIFSRQRRTLADLAPQGLGIRWLSKDRSAEQSSS